MPKQTFYNLTEEKREKVLEVSIDEFSQNMYNTASITKIAERCGIAKGSMYQYFQDKKDLYKYILDQIGVKKFSYFTEIIGAGTDIRFIDTIRMLYKKGLEFAIDHPKLASIGSNFIKEDGALKDEILKDNVDKSNIFFIRLIEQAKDRGEIHPEIDSTMGAFIIYHFNNALIDSLLSSINYDDIFSHQDIYFKKVDDLLFILENGFISSGHRN